MEIKLIKMLLKFNIAQIKKLFLKDNSIDTDTLFYHCPHGQPENGINLNTKFEFHALSRRILSNPNNKKYSFPKSIAIVTYNNRQHSSLIEKCYDTYGVIPYFVLAKKYTPWDWLGKIKSVLDFLSSPSAEKYEYVLATDASDVLLINSPTDIIERFSSYDAEIVFCNTVANWPPNDTYNNFELSKYYSTPFHAHLSAGGYFGKKEFILKYLKEIIDAHNNQATWAFFNGRFDDQQSWRHLHQKYYPKLKIDNKSLIFKRFDNFRRL
jgi:hypothetical protein